MSAPTPVPAAPEGTRPRRTSAVPTVPPLVTAALGALAVAALILFVTRLLIFDTDRLVGDFPNDAWYIRHQADALRAMHTPSLFLTASVAAFYPIFAFYGGTLFVAIAALSVLTGLSAAGAQSVTYIIAIAAAYGGWYWLARLAGVRGWVAHAPAVVYVTAPYVVTNLYAREDLVETVATAAMPLMVAAAISVGRADRLRPGPAAALAASTIAFTGSHNLTLLWGTLYLLLAAALVWALVPATRRLIPRAGALRIAAVVAPAVAVNAWFLLPDLVYANDTAIAQRVDQARGFLRTPTSELSLGHLLTPTRPDDGHGAGYTLPVLVLAWTLVAVVTARAPRPSAWLRVWGLMVVVTLAIAVLMGQAHVLAGLPKVFVYLQSTVRLDTFALFSLCGALIAALALTPPRAPLMGLLVAALAVGILQAAVQIANVPSGVPGLTIGAEGPSTFGLGDYADNTLPIVIPPPALPVTSITHAMTDGDTRATVTVDAVAGDTILTNLMGPAALIAADGAHVVGRWNAGPAQTGFQDRWYLVLQVDDDAPGTRQQITIHPARAVPIVAGRVISILGLLGLAAVAVTTARRHHRT